MINDVYRVIQVILNKNNYGVLTPDRFNVLAKAAQEKIIGELPNDIFRAKNRRNRSGLADAIRPLQNALDTFSDRTTIQREADAGSPNGFSDYFVLPEDFDYEDSLWFQSVTKITQIDKKNGREVLKNKLTAPDTQFPVYEKRGGKIYVFPETIGLGEGGLTTDVTMYYQRRPKDPKWTYIIVNNKPVYNPSDVSFQNFELPEYMFDRIVIEIALLSGIHLREQDVEQYMNQEQADNFQKQNLT